MSDAQRKTISMNTPKGIAKWPKLTEPDYGTKDYPSPEGVYSVKLVFNENDPDFIKFKAKLGPYMDAVRESAETKFAALKKPLRDKLKQVLVNEVFTPIYDADDQPTGQVELKLSMKASGVVKKGPRTGRKWERKPDMYDALGRKITKPVSIWGGSELIASFTFDPDGYFIEGTGATGIKCQLAAVQIITLRQGGDKSAESYGFAAREDGFSADDLPDDTASEGSDDEFQNGDEPHLPSGGGTDPAGAADF